MALNTDPNFPPSGNAPFAINREWCMGDSLGYINANSDNFDSRINNVTTNFVSLSSSFTRSLSSSGYQTLPGGLILQWGLFFYTGGTSDSQPVTWNFPIPFPNSVVNFSITPQYNGPINGNVSGYVESTTLTNAVVGLDGSAGFGSLTNIPVYISVTGY